jgi:hypothetical protein
VDPTRWIKGIWIALSIGVIITACDLTVKATRPAAPTNYEYVCERIGELFNKMKEVECRLLPEPILVESKVSYNWRWLGAWFHFEPYIFIAYGLDEPLRTTVIQHEAAHYYLHNLGLIENVNDNCEHERLARLISEGDEDEWDAKAKQVYGCTKD